LQPKDRIVGHKINIEDAAPGAPVAGDRQGEIAAHGSELFVGYADSADNEAVFFRMAPL